MIKVPSSGRSLLLIGLVAYLLFAIVRFPAALAVAWFAPEAIQASGVNGTVWLGQAGTIATPVVTFSDTRWQARPLALLTAKLSFDINTHVDSGVIDTVAAISPGGTIHLRDLRGVLPLSALPKVDPAVNIDGRIGLDLQQLRIKDQWITDAHGTVDIVGLNVISPVAENLGSFVVSFNGLNDTDILEGLVSEVNGPLVVSGTLSLPADKKWSLAGTVKPTSSASSQLAQGLAFMGSRNPDGSYNLSYPPQ